jgi:hypothetical protein
MVVHSLYLVQKHEKVFIKKEMTQEIGWRNTCEPYLS